MNVVDRSALLNSPISVALRTSFVSRYLAKHFEMFPQEYRYSGSARNLRLSYKVEVSKPFTLDFSNHFTGPKGLRIAAHAPQVNFEFRRMPDDVLLGRLSLSAAVTVSLLLPVAPDEPFLTVFENVDVTIGSTIIEAGAELSQAGCDLKDLIEHLAEVISGEYLAKYFDDLEIPNPAQALSEVPMTLTELSTDGSYLYIRAVLSARSSMSDVDGMRAHAFPAEALDLMVSGVESFLKKAPGADGEGETLELHTDFRKAKNLLGEGTLRKCARYKKGKTKDDLVVWISEAALDLIVHRKLNFEKSEILPGDSGNFKVEGEYGYRVYDAHASLSGLGCIVRSEFVGFLQGSIKGRKWWNKWFFTRVTGGAKAIPFLSARCDFRQSPDGRQLRLLPIAFPFVTVSWVHFSNPILWIIEVFLNLFLNALGNLLSTTLIPLLSIFLNIRVVDLPVRLKGSPVPVRPLLSGVDEGASAILVFAELQV